MSQSKTNVSFSFFLPYIIADHQQNAQGVIQEVVHNNYNETNESRSKIDS